MSALRIIFAGTPDFAAEHLAALLESHHQVVAVFTQPDRPAGRGKKLQASPVKELAQSNHIPVHQPERLRSAEDQSLVRQYDADLMVVVAYGLLLPQAVLDMPRLGCINVHASLLPRWRGAAPIQRCIEAGDTETGVTIMQMDAGLDTGAMLTVSRCAIDAQETSASLHDKLITLGRPALIEAVDLLAENRATAVAQDDSLATYAHKLTKEEARIDWRLPADVIARRVRAFNPFPVAFTTIGEARLRIWSAVAVRESSGAAAGTLTEIVGSGSQTTLRIACGEGQLEVTHLQLPGKKAMAVVDCLAGYRAQFALGSILGDAE
ncbi:methionyl-tRNA formyltransferase [Simiduia aestuariiviva]|uniref:Methionyl-tRNA formyltransferase n=1 Tax=Simiduia aestuariiviva TaxID=1510459 RepID=A0A839UWH0_9GAMM|nr:methionyl-tRNA formyltransferase [Simiduia aestuariiviva]MBB3169808.1 methionyl-tRNA formyltransferase [Simiduia aestuariiviva]